MDDTVAHYGSIAIPAVDKLICLSEGSPCRVRRLGMWPDGKWALVVLLVGRPAWGYPRVSVHPIHRVEGMMGQRGDLLFDLCVLGLLQRRGLLR